MDSFSLLKSKRFLPLFLTQFLGAFNDNFFKNAFVILLTFKSGGLMGLKSSQMVALTGGIFILPFFLFSAQAGQIADKFEKTRIIHWVKLAEILMMVIATIGFLTHNTYLLLTVVFLMGAHSTVFGPVKYSILPQHLTSEEIVGGNGFVEAGTFIAVLLGTIAGGVLITVEPNGALIVSVGLIVCAIAGWATSLKIPEAPAVSPDLKISWNPITPTVEILKFTKKTPSVFNSMLGISWFWFFGSALLSLFPPYCKDWLGTNESVVTLFLSIFSIGIAVGSILCERLSRRHLELGLVPFGSIGISLFTADLFFVGKPTFPGAVDGIVGLSQFLSAGAGQRIVFDLFALSVFSGLFIVPLYTMMQTRSEATHRSRIIAGNNIVNALFMVIAALYLVFLIEKGAEIPYIILTLSGLNIAVSLYIYLLIPEFLLRFIVWGIANIMYRMRVEGEDNIPVEGPAILVCNHVTFIDWMIIAAGVKRPVRFIMDHSFFKGFLIKRLLTRAKVIPIAPAKENPELLRMAFEKAAEELRAGEIVCIFPEGKITFDGNLNPFKPGVEKMLNETPVPVIPLALVNLWGSFFSRKGGKAGLKVPRRFWSRITLRIGQPVPAKVANATVLQQKVEELLRT